MKFKNLLLAACLSAVGTPGFSQHAGHGGAHHGHAPSPYAGEQTRDIKALSAQEQRAWAEGQGMGLARAAELNGYPGPMHVLELAQGLELSEAQAAATRDLMHAHKQEVRQLGARLVEAERELDQLFRERRVSEAEIARRTQGIADLQARIRASHLQTHLKQTALLSPVQVERYAMLRGYR